MKKIFLLLMMGIIVTSSQIRGEITLPKIFADNMVLQQKSDVSIWGWAKPDATVRVTTSWNKKSYSVKSDPSGYWILKVRTPVAGYTPYSITVTDGKPIHLKDILIGEVWLCSGQSNMEMPMRGFQGQPIENGPEAISNSNPFIHFFKVDKVSTLYPQDSCSGTWMKSNIQTLPELSATAYFFARLIQQNLDVPVGLIQSSWGGTPIEAWMPPASLQDFPEKKIPTTQEEIKSATWTPTLLYNGIIHPLVGYGIRGVIWYQGEANTTAPGIYAKLFENMVVEWRRLWGIGDFPFYYCQIAPYNYGSNRNSAYLREAQVKSMKITNTGMAVLMDSESPDCIHPPRKKEAGERMALWALARTYGMDNIHYRSPELRSFEIEGRMVTLTFGVFNHPGLTSYDKEIKNFVVAGEDKQFYPAKAAILGNKVFLFSPRVAEPVAVRYCFDNTSASEIFSVEGNLPISSFRTDEW